MFVGTADADDPPREISFFQGALGCQVTASPHVADQIRREGRAVVALASDPDVLRHNGTVRVVADLAREYGFADIDGKTPTALTLADV